MEVFGCYHLRASLRDVFAESVYPLHSRILLVPLCEDEYKCWMKFKELVQWRRKHKAFFKARKRCFECGKPSVELDHPIVPIVSEFVVAAFNELCRMYVKKGVEDNIYEAEVVDVKYSPNCYGYLFVITLEAMEENAAGVYEATILCHCDDGRRTLIKFIRSPCPPVGKKYKRMVEITHEKSMCEAVKEKRQAMKAELERRCTAMKVTERPKKSAEFRLLKKDYKAIKGACRIFDQYAHLVTPIGWKIKSSNLDNWFIPNKITGLLPRSAEHSYGGYDYRNPLPVFSRYTDD